ncbi:VOC family protein [Trinickia terrae]|uniref:VOC family protein n=1 Tax=Trinickia terrae TaxID=2571161 RepID=A0A4U1HPB3_9BURK|nr:VOC family protein [Trinickia terrae]TKC83131.1 VOC family protein [Trinickia terrae]
MTARPLQLDHLVVAARTLDEGAQFVADTLSVELAAGGAHPLMRTHNRLLNLWGGTYLEVIAIDPEAEASTAAGGAEGKPPRKRLFALDDPATHARLARGPYLAHWVARVERPQSLVRWQAQYPERIAPIVPMTRGDLSWSLSVPEDGAFPGRCGAGDGIVPTLIQWDTPQHPSARLPHTGLALKSLTGFHPRADEVRVQLDWLGASHLIRLEATEGEPALVAEIEIGLSGETRTLK